MFKYKACNGASSINLSFNFVPCDIFVVNLSNEQSFFSKFFVILWNILINIVDFIVYTILKLYGIEYRRKDRVWYWFRYRLTIGSIGTGWSRSWLGTKSSITIGSDTRGWCAAAAAACSRRGCGGRRRGCGGRRRS